MHKLHSKKTSEVFFERIGRKRPPRSFLALLLLFAAPAFAQVPTVRRVEFDEAVMQALARNPSMTGAQVAIAEADAGRQQARALTRP